MNSGIKIPEPYFNSRELQNLERTVGLESLDLLIDTKVVKIKKIRIFTKSYG
jgi:hypothetical protein